MTLAIIFASMALSLFIVCMCALAQLSAAERERRDRATKNRTRIRNLERAYVLLRRGSLIITVDPVMEELCKR